MKQLKSFIKKEFLEIYRTGKGYILIILFVIFGIMNPAFAKLTPWLYEALSSSLKEQGIVIEGIQVTAMTSWEQYFKNMSMEYIVIVVMFGGILTGEYQKGTLVNILTKGLSRWKVIAAKAITMFISWTVCYWTCFLITYGYNAYFWDNRIALNIGLAALTSYLFGMLLISILFMFSVFLSTSTAVLLCTGAVYAGIHIISMVPSIEKYLPSRLEAGLNLMKGTLLISDFTPSIVITSVLIIAFTVISVLGFNKRKI